MPIYEFECKRCKEKFELLVRSGATPLECPQCSGKDLKRLMSAFAFTSKDGSGAATAASSSGCSGCAGGDCSHCAH
jgi:putative FmdB family regulatory protein